MTRDPRHVCRRQALRACCFADAHALAHAVAHTLAQAMAEDSGGAASAVMLAGGTTPLAAYGLLTAEPPVAARGLHVFFSDDRLVPPSDARSNYGATRPMLEALGLPPDRVVRVRGERPLDDAVRAYQEELDGMVSRGVTLRLGLLGLGADGHTASLFSPEQVAHPRYTWATGVSRPDGLEGVSVTPALLQRVQRIVFVVSGATKRDMAHLLVRMPSRIPAGLAVAGHPAVELWTDADAWPFTGDAEADAAG